MLATYNEVNMNNKYNFDTLRYANRLKAVGVPEKQAELQAELQAETLSKIDEVINEKLATKRDLKELELAMGRDIKELELALKRDMKELELRLSSKIGTKIASLGGMIIAGFTILGILIKLH